MDKQPNSHYCFLCGVANPIGLKIAFYQASEACVVVRFVPREEHQGYPGVLHGGIISALLDETIGRTLVPRDRWGMTVELTVRFLASVPIGRPLTIEGELTRLRSRTMEGSGRVLLEDGTVAATAEAKYILLNDQQTERFKEGLGYWQVVPDELAK